MKILVTNDDGIQSESLKILVKKAMQFGEVLCIAPIEEQSGKSQSLIIKEPFIFKQVEDIIAGVKTYVISSTPADCVRVAYYYLKEDFDIVLSGINNGYNLGEDITYSGTVGAACEGVFHNKKAIAFSAARNGFSNIEQNLDIVFNEFESMKLLEKHDFWNVNICENPKGIKYTMQGYTNFDSYFVKLDGDYIAARGAPDHARDKDRKLSDVSAIYNNYISITPLTADRTKHEVLKKVINK
jgi:5'-nucleotidase